MTIIPLEVNGDFKKRERERKKKSFVISEDEASHSLKRL